MFHLGAGRWATAGAEGGPSQTAVDEARSQAGPGQQGGQGRRGGDQEQADGAVRGHDLRGDRHLGGHQGQVDTQGWIHLTHLMQGYFPCLLLFLQLFLLAAGG